MNIIFLDIDGVINTDRQIRINDLKQVKGIEFDPIAMENLKKIIIETKAKIVIISTWKVHREKEGFLWVELIRNLKKYSIDEESIHDVTPYLGEYKPEIRIKEINTYLEKNKNIDRYVILDDQWDMGNLNPSFIRCLSFKGITEEIKKEAIEKLTTN